MAEIERVSGVGFTSVNDSLAARIQSECLNVLYAEGLFLTIPPIMHHWKPPEMLSSQCLSILLGRREK